MWRQLASDSLIRPREAARRVLAVEIQPMVLIEAAAAIACTGLVLGYIGMRLSDGAIDPVSAAVLRAPFAGAAMQFVILAAAAALTYRIGRSFGGAGQFWACVQVIVWLNVLTLGLQILQLGVVMVAPAFATLVAIATLIWLFWAYANFVAELHGFGSPAMVLGVTVLAMVLIVIGVTLLVAILGLAPQGS